MLMNLVDRTFLAHHLNPLAAPSTTNFSRLCSRNMSHKVHENFIAAVRGVLYTNSEPIIGRATLPITHRYATTTCNGRDSITHPLLVTSVFLSLLLEAVTITNLFYFRW